MAGAAPGVGVLLRGTADAHGSWDLDSELGCEATAGCESAELTAGAEAEADGDAGGPPSAACSLLQAWVSAFACGM